MLPEKIMQSDLLDILFENRNKNYGAYALRKSYNKIMMTSIVCTLFVACAFSIFQFFHHAQKEKIISVFIPPDATLIKVLPDKKMILPSPKPQAATHFKQINNSTPVIAPDDEVKKLQHTTDELDKAIIGPIDLKGKDNDIIQPPAELENNTGSVVTSTSQKIKEDLPLHSAEIMPEFPGGEKALIKFILQNVRQPDDLEPGQQIRVLASLIVSKTGAIENVKIISSGRPDLDKEVMRVINKMPLWKPGMQNGQPVSVYFNLPVTFESAD